MKEERIVKYLSLFVFALITLFLLFKIPPFWDVAHSWLIAKEFGLSDLFFHIEKRDGHLFIWHLLQMPFAKNNFFYPYPAYFLNWLFCMGALIIFWNKAPFSNLTKMLFTFSYPVLWYFAPVARCYSIGLLFLFLIL
ncbi:MAG: hypothetical protein Q4F80_05470, partial [bacterium]|nr:hypothetical protein [bacterium]